MLKGQLCGSPRTLALSHIISMTTDTQQFFCQSPSDIVKICLEFGELGCHVLADFSECESIPDTSALLETQMLKAARASEATIVESTFHSFSPIGLSGVVVIAESHLACHTWPEHNFACVDFFSCSTEINMIAAIESLWHSFRAKKVSIQQVARGRKG